MSFNSLVKRLYSVAFPQWTRNALQAQLRYIERYSLPQVIEKPPGTRVLVLAPHADDETIGCGGTLTKCVSADIDLRVLILTDGRNGSPQLRELSETDLEKAKLQAALVKRRRDELQSAMELIGITSYRFLDAVDGRLSDDASRIGEFLAEEIAQWKPHTIILPFLSDRHADHFGANRCLMEACAQLEDELTREITCMGFETWSPIYANTLVDISSVIDTKLKAIQCYKSQTSSLDYAAAVEGLNRYRAVTGMCGGPYAEAFYVCKLPEYTRLYQQFLLSSL